jgi:hypothetical protein
MCVLMDFFVYINDAFFVYINDAYYEYGIFHIRALIDCGASDRQFPNHKRRELQFKIGEKSHLIIRLTSHISWMVAKIRRFIVAKIKRESHLPRMVAKFI